MGFPTSELPKVDPDFPASLSKKCIDIIRNKGFDGVCFTDSFAMMGVLRKYVEENINGMAIAAGNDIILPNYRTPTRKVSAMLKKNFEDGAFTMERLDEAVRRVLAAQEYYEKHKVNANPATAEDKELLRSVSRDCITAVTDEGVEAALGGSNEDKLFVTVTEQDAGQDVHNPEVTADGLYHPDKIAKKIHSEFPGCGCNFYPRIFRQQGQ
ncbi:MAG: hypothetical protein IJ428_00525 [Clostridia bacterium]|nr:hypothetical protein [Clostridia bacterium]